MNEFIQQLNEAKEKCEQYWNESKIPDSEVHAILEFIHKRVNNTLDRLSKFPCTKDGITVFPGDKVYVGPIDSGYCYSIGDPMLMSLSAGYEGDISPLWCYSSPELSKDAYNRCYKVFCPFCDTEKVLTQRDQEYNTSFCENCSTTFFVYSTKESEEFISEWESFVKRIDN